MTKKIFITTPWFVPAFRAGGLVQSIANLVKEFNKNVEYFIICQDVDLNGAVLEGVETDTWVRYNDHTQVWYTGPEKVSDTVVRQVEEIKPDFLYIVGMFSWHFNIVPMLFCKGPKKILSTRGMLHGGALSQKKWKKRIYLRIFKLLEYHYKVQFHATDEEEKNFIINYFGNVAKVSVAGNFPNKLDQLPVASKEPGMLKLVSVAVISPMKNILLVLQALEKVAGNVQYDIYGPVKDEDYWDHCLSLIRKLPRNISVVVHKEIEPQKVKQVLSDAHVFILPSKSENFGHSIYEALSAARPVITSTHTPWNGLKESSAGINVNIEVPAELIDAMNFFVGLDEVQMKSWSESAHEYAEKALDIETVKREYAIMFGVGESS